VDEIFNPDVGEEGMPEGSARPQAVAIASPLAPPAQETRFGKIADNRRDAALGDAEGGCDLPHCRPGMTGEIEEGEAVVCYKMPGRPGFPRHRAILQIDKNAGGGTS